jgi:Fic family protein
MDKVGRIYAQLERVAITAEQLPNSLELRRQNRIEAAHSSTVIEGNRLTLGEATAVAAGEPVYAPPKDVLEFANALAAHDSLDSFDPYSVDSFLQAHARLMAGLIDEAGAFRTVEVDIVNSAGEAVHSGSRAFKVPRLIGELLEWAASTADHPLIASSAVHFLIEQIHPFRDGNGRIGRLWQTLILSRWNPLLAWTSSATVTRDNQADYYLALQASREPELDAAPFITFMLGVIGASLTRQAKLLATLAGCGANRRARAAVAGA